MTRLRQILLVVAAVSAWEPAGSAASAAEPRNLDLLKAEIRDYVKSGEYQRDIAAVAAKADAWLVERAAKKVPGERITVVFSPFRDD